MLAGSRRPLFRVSDARRRVWRVVAIGAGAVMFAVGTVGCSSSRVVHRAGAGRALAVKLAADYTATWQHRLRFSFAVDDSEANRIGYNGVADLAGDAADFSAMPDGFEVRLIRDVQYTKGALAGAAADRWVITPKSMPDAISALRNIVPMPQDLAKNLAASAASIHPTGPVTDDGVPATSYQWTAPSTTIAGLHVAPGTTEPWRSMSTPLIWCDAFRYE